VDEIVKAELIALDQAITSKLITSEEINNSDLINNDPIFLHLQGNPAEENDSLTPHFDPVEPEAAMPEAEEFTPEEFDKYIAAEVLLPKGDSMVLGRIINPKRDAHGNPIGVAHSNPIFDTHLYQVQFPRGQVEEYSANNIAHNLYSQLDSEGNRFLLMDQILDFEKTDEVLPPEDCFTIGLNGNIHKRRTTKGWTLCIQWKDGSTSWEPLKDMKELFPIQVTEFAVNRGLQQEAAFSWWVKDTLARKNSIVKAMKSRYVRKMHKYGIRLPKDIKEAYELDRESGTDYWHQAIVKEMTNNASAFQFLEPEENIPIGSTWIPSHMIFDVKVDLTRKARFVAGGHWTDPPTHITYSTVVSRDSVRMAFLIAALNDLEIFAADIGNAYLNAPMKEKVHTTAGPEFGPNRVGQTVLIVRALYGLSQVVPHGTRY
jgi:hypothetical protein